MPELKLIQEKTQRQLYIVQMSKWHIYKDNNITQLIYRYILCATASEMRHSDT
jgi:hypothetical protein